MPLRTVQMSLYDIYNDVCNALEDDKPRFLRLLEEHIDFSSLIPVTFHWAFNCHIGRPREYSLESFVRFCVLQKIIGIEQDKTFLNVLAMSEELRDFCGFDKVPDASKITRFKQDFVVHIKAVFDKLVELTEPICREMDPKKADYLIYDPTGIEVRVAENNPKFMNGILDRTKKLAKNNPDINPHAMAYGLMPKNAEANPFAEQQYINGHFCYAFKAGILANGLGIIRDISLFDDEFKYKHPEAVSQKTDNPALDKVIGDSTSLKPVLNEFFSAHPTFSYRTFLGDTAFDSYDNFKMLRDDFHFSRVAIPLNPRNSSSANANAEFTANGTPVCPIDKTPFIYLGASRGENRSERFKWVCHKSEKLLFSSARVCICETPCTDSLYGRCVYTYPDKDFRLYPGIPRGTEHWNNLYRHRVLIERSIYLLKDTLCGAPSRSLSMRTAKADLLFAGIAHLIGVVLAHAIKEPKLYKSIRRLTAKTLSA